MRLEANISWGLDLDYKVEVKNLNSFRFLEKAIEFELSRQKQILDSGETPIQETRGWNESKSETQSQRSKETAADYRYFPEPDIPPIVIGIDWITNLKNNLPLLPEELSRDLKEKYELKAQYISIIAGNKELYNLVTQSIVLGEKQGLDANLITSSIINKKIPEGLDAAEIIQFLQDQSKSQVNNEEQLSIWVNEAISANPKAVTDINLGKLQALGAIIGYVMKLSSGTADAAKVREIIKRKLKV